MNKTIRTDSLNKLYTVLNDEQMSKDIEIGCHIFTKEYVIAHTNELLHDYVSQEYQDNFINTYTVEIYKTKINEILYNLNKANNPTLIFKLEDGSILPKTVAFLEFDNIDPTCWKPIVEKLKYREEKENNIATTNMFTCTKCKESRCTIKQLQIRSADEPMTVFVTCVVCGFQFKIE